MGDSGRFSSLCSGAPQANRWLADTTGWHPGAESILPREPPIQPWPDLPRRVAGASVARRCPGGAGVLPCSVAWTTRRENVASVLWKVVLPCPADCSLWDVSAVMSCEASPACCPSGPEKAALEPPRQHGPHFQCSLARWGEALACHC